ncbi:unnamed protein product [Auanema sp. JU1783]|nr:unnamed protein product [Auanema sp. JU1783]
MVKHKAHYFLIEIIHNDDDKKEHKTFGILGALTKAIHEIHGEVGLAAVRYSLIVKVTDNNVFCVKVESSNQHYLSTVLPFVTSITSTPLVLRTLFVGRSIRTCEKFLVKFRRNELYGLYSQAESGVEKKHILSALAAVTGKIE